MLADYIVYLKPRSPPTTPEVRNKPRDKLKKNSERQTDILKNVRWKKFKTFLNNEEIRLIVNRVGYTRSGLYIIDFSIYSTENQSINPRWIKITQRKKEVPIYKLFFDGLALSPEKNVSGLICLKRKTLSFQFPLQMKFHRNRTSTLTIKEIRKWSKN